MNRNTDVIPALNSNLGDIYPIHFKSGFTQRRYDATKGHKGINLMGIRNLINANLPQDTKMCHSRSDSDRESSF